MNRANNTYAFLRYLFPHTRQRARTRLSGFRTQIVPKYRLRLQSRILRYILKRQAKTQRRKAAGKTILARLGIGRRNRAFAALRLKYAQHSHGNKMMQQGGMPGFGSQRGTSESNGYLSGSEKGTRRKKLAGYIKAAQSYIGSPQYDGEDGYGVPGSFPELTAARSGEEEMILFPSYARRHYPKKRSNHDIPRLSEDLRNSREADNADYWKREWEEFEDGKSIVDVDVRGWIYSPHRGAMSRKQRIVVGIARRLGGIPAQSSSTDSREASPLDMVRGRLESHVARHEEEQIEREAASLASKGEGAANMAWRGEYCEPPSARSRTPSPDKERSPRPSLRSSEGSIYDDASSLNSLAKRASWNQPQDMNPAEIAVANAHLMSRLKPFLHIPLINTPLTVFFYSDNTSKSRQVTTNEYGHFSLRTPLDFIPTHVRVLASEKLSAVEEVQLTEPKGLSVISDIDDTIKHSGIGNGAKEIFRNVFIRELGDLTIEGVKEWYSKMADKGVQFHYVSNAPWQLYPVLTSFFAMAGLPKGSYHLKQYNGMLQGIFEPVAERKKGTLEKILQDFPQRRFILVGDSGEADLELYTDIVLANPGRILGVFIRDVTTTKQQGFFDSSIQPLRQRGSRSPTRGRSKDDTSFAKRKSMPDLLPKPNLPPRPSVRSIQTNAKLPSTGPKMGQLIDYEESPSQSINRYPTNQGPEKSSPPPPRPTKPASLRSVSGESLSMTPVNPQSSSTLPNRKPIPPPKPRQYSVSETHPTDPSPLSQTQTASPPGSRASSLERQSYRAAMRNKVVSAYNSLPSWSSYAEPSPPPQRQPGSTSVPRPTPADDLNRKEKLPPPIPPRRNLSSYPAAAAHYASNRLSGGWSGNPEGAGANTANGNGNGAGGGGGGGGSGVGEEISKKEEMWKRRWAAAKGIFEEKGVLLRCWRRGEDVMDEAIGLVERARREEEEEGGSRSWERRNGAGR
ncbi:MAG: hypothetical protein HETSPECPRED_009076 [Heterodermia speciosa]|uniref:Phosphatidate phosphatase APP1 catalytic domain-containing protein n=1 Tax=Heterodermia speciosa TaxID=116794 RepID=A0A8H3FXE3_9LECA|nr:MAG: hypothetical protein HETSPECPRED_009076 [Heterodermia speciosa]